MSENQILRERRGSHGELSEGARVMQDILRACERARNWGQLPDEMRLSLQLIALKISRIMVGDPMVADHWDDIVGYAQLISDRLDVILARMGGAGPEEVERMTPEEQRELDQRLADMLRGIPTGPADSATLPSSGPIVPIEEMERVYGVGREEPIYRDTIVPSSDSGRAYLDDPTLRQSSNRMDWLPVVLTPLARDQVTEEQRAHYCRVGDEHQTFWVRTDLVRQQVRQPDLTWKEWSDLPHYLQPLYEIDARGRYVIPGDSSIEVPADTGEE